MQVDILTLFPQMFQSLLGSGIFKRAIDHNLVRVNIYNIRDYTHDKHHTVDDYPYGGGAGMVLKPEPIFEAVETITSDTSPEHGDEVVPIVLLTPQGRLFSQQVALELSKYRRLILICGHYEGVDERVREHLVTDEISIGDYVLSGGELAAMVVTEAVARLVPRHLYSMHQEAKSQGKDLPIAIVIGACPPVLIAAATSIPYGDDELNVAAAIRKQAWDEPIQVARLPGTGLTVPAVAEFIRPRSAS